MCYISQPGVFGEPQARCAAERDLKQLVDAGLAQLRAGAGHEQFYPCVLYPCAVYRAVGRFPPFAAAANLGFGRIAVSYIEAPNLFVSTV